MPFQYESIRFIIEGGNQTAAKMEQPAEPVITSPSATPVQTPTPPPAEKIPEQPVQQTIDLTPPANVGSVGEAFTGKMSDFEPDARIPKALRDLMISNNVNEWDVQRVVEARGYFPGDMPVYDYPKDFIEGVLVGAWDQVYAMIKEMNEKEAIPFN